MVITDQNRRTLVRLMAMRLLLCVIPVSESLAGEENRINEFTDFNPEHKKFITNALILDATISIMEKKFFVLHLIPPRPDFPFTMTDEERAIMTNHVGYWKNKMDEGYVIAFGPVFDPKGPYGLGIVSVESDDQLQEFMKNDPANGLNRYEFFPMNAVVREKVNP